MSNVNASLSPLPLSGGSINSDAGNSAPVGGRRRSKKLRLVKKKTVKRMLKKMGLKLRGGNGSPMAAGAVGSVVVPDDKPASKDAESESDEESKVGARRRRGGKKSRKTRRGKKSLFGLKY